MEVIKFSIVINATREKVWNTMLQDTTYRIWTKEFAEGSHYEGSWEKGSEIHFLGPDEDGNLGGMYSRIKENVEYEFISIEHLGMISKGIIDTTSEEVKKWTPSFENYILLPKENQTELLVEMNTTAEFVPMFEEMWPRALKSLKNICEK
ncbi:MAG TPA: SRPBCC domain-containing protein [Leadbetterella sp.]|nr:SRPBCC domain-containing protein [Leadbetterella sp.]